MAKSKEMLKLEKKQEAELEALGKAMKGNNKDERTVAINNLRMVHIIERQEGELWDLLDKNVDEKKTVDEKNLSVHELLGKQKKEFGDLFDNCYKNYADALGKKVPGNDEHIALLEGVLNEYNSNNDGKVKAVKIVGDYPLFGPESGPNAKKLYEDVAESLKAIGSRGGDKIIVVENSDKEDDKKKKKGREEDKEDKDKEDKDKEDKDKDTSEDDGDEERKRKSRKPERMVGFLSGKELLFVNLVISLVLGIILGVVTGGPGFAAIPALMFGAVLVWGGANIAKRALIHDNPYRPIERNNQPGNELQQHQSLGQLRSLKKSDLEGLLKECGTSSLTFEARKGFQTEIMKCLNHDDDKLCDRGLFFKDKYGNPFPKNQKLDFKRDDHKKALYDLAAYIILTDSKFDTETGREWAKNYSFSRIKDNVMGKDHANILMDLRCNLQFEKDFPAVIDKLGENLSTKEDVAKLAGKIARFSSLMGDSKDPAVIKAKGSFLIEVQKKLHENNELFQDVKNRDGSVAKNLDNSAIRELKPGKTDDEAMVVRQKIIGEAINIIIGCTDETGKITDPDKEHIADKNPVAKQLQQLLQVQDDAYEKRKESDLKREGNPDPAKGKSNENPDGKNITLDSSSKSASRSNDSDKTKGFSKI